MNIARMILPVLLLVGLLTYLLWHVWALVPLPRPGKWVTVAIAVFCFSLEFVALSGLSAKMPMGLASAVYNIGNKTLIIMLYMIMAFLLLDLGRLVRLVPRTMLHDSLPTTIGIAAVMIAVFAYGSIHYHNKQRVELTIAGNGKIAKPTKAVMVSDLHIGYHNRRKDLAKWIDLINSENPDLVLIAGDIIDFSLRPVIEEDMAAEFRRIKAPVFACLGNHEYFSGAPEAMKFYRDANIGLLIDSSAMLPDHNLLIIGRDDRTNAGRQPLSHLVSSADTASHPFTILLDHQPYHLEEAEQQGIDFQFSGHTHRGQVWPISWIVDAMYECSWGSHRRGNTGYYVSSGLGIWGAKYRIGSQSEYIVATIK